MVRPSAFTKKLGSVSILLVHWCYFVGYPPTSCSATPDTDHAIGRAAIVLASAFFSLVCTASTNFIPFYLLLINRWSQT